MGKDHQAILEFAIKYYGWHGYDPRCLDTMNSVRHLESLGLVEISPSHQFRAITLKN